MYSGHFQTFIEDISVIPMGLLVCSGIRGFSRVLIVVPFTFDADIDSWTMSCREAKCRPNLGRRRSNRWTWTRR